MRRTLCFLMLAAAAVHLYSQTTLYPGDLAIINVNSDGNKNFDVLIFKDIQVGTMIRFTDDAWINATQQFRGSEGILTYTASSNLLAGTVITCPGIDGGNGFVKTSGSFNPSTSGDNIIVYQGSADDPFFLFGAGWARGSTVWEYSESSASYRSDVPPGLSLTDQTILSLGTDDNYRYNPAALLSGTPADLLTSISTPASWQPDNTNPFTPFPTGFTITLSPDHLSTPTTISTLSTLHSLLSIYSTVTISGSISLQSLTIQPGGVLEILPGASLRVFGEIDNQAGVSGLIIRSDATGSGQLMHSCPGVSGTVERFIGAGQWHFVASPITETLSVNEVFGTGTDSRIRVYRYDETAGQWVNSAGSIIRPWVGYNILYPDGDHTVTFQGTLNAFRTRSSYQVTRGAGSGWNLLGNPFACGLSWGSSDQTDARGWKNQVGVLEHKTIWVTTGGSGNGSTFATFNGSSGIGVPDNNVGTIAPGQAFWVRAAASGELGVGTYAQSLAGSTFKKRGIGEEENGGRGEEGNGRIGEEGIIRFVLGSEATGASDQAALVMDERAEEGVDRFDSEKIGDVPLAIAFPEQSTRLVINSVPMLAGTDTVDLEVRIPGDGYYSISVSTHPLINLSTKLRIEDLRSGLVQELAEGKPYTFFAEAGNQAGRFRLIVTTTSGRLDGTDPWISGCVDKWILRQQGERMILTLDEYTDNQSIVSVVDLLGHEVGRYTLNGGDREIAFLKPRIPGVYIAKLQNEDRISSKKFYSDK